MIEYSANQIPLYMLLGALSFLTMHILRVMTSELREKFNFLGLAWTLLAIGFTLARLFQRGAVDSDVAVLAIRLQIALTFGVGWLSVATIQAFARRDVLTKDVVIYGALGLVGASLVTLTPWFVPHDVYLREDIFGVSYSAVRLGWATAALIGPYGLAAAWLSVRAFPKDGRLLRHYPAFLAMAVLFVLTGFNDLLMGAGVIASFHMFEYGFAAVALASGLLVQRRADWHHEKLEAEVQRRTRELSESEERFRGLVAASLEGVIVHTDGEVNDCNDAVVRIIQRPTGELIGRHIADLLGVDRQTLRPIIEAINPTQTTLDFTDIQGVVHKLELLGRGRQGDQQVLIIRDVTERLAMEARLRRSERLVSLGTLAAGTAHEINNPLMSVTMNATFLAERLAELEQGIVVEEGPTPTELLDDLIVGADRVRRIVHDLMSMAREPEPEDLDEVSLQEAVQRALELADHELQHRARVCVALDEAGYVLGSAHRVEQVFVNLLVNAAQAIPVGQVDANEVNVRVGRVSPTRSFVEVEDSGVGMTPSVLERVFDPFYTTKGVGEGTGLGLAISAAIVGSMGGSIEATSTPGKGTLFRVELPSGERRAELANHQRSTGSTEATGAILIIDDDEFVSRALARALQGHHVVIASSGSEALQLCATTRTFDVVLCDLQMPDCSGMELYARLRASSPELAERTVFMTGGLFTREAKRFVAETDNQVLFKPIDPVKLRGLITSMLQPKHAARALEGGVVAVESLRPVLDQ